MQLIKGDESQYVREYISNNLIEDKKPCFSFPENTNKERSWMLQHDQNESKNSVHTVYFNTHKSNSKHLLHKEPSCTITLQ